MLGVPERGYYQWMDQQERRRLRRLKEEHLREAIYNAFIENKRVFGVIRIKRYLEEEKGLLLTEYKVRRIMRENGLYAIPEKKFKKPSKGKKNKS